MLAIEQAQYGGNDEWHQWSISSAVSTTTISHYYFHFLVSSLNKKKLINIYIFYLFKISIIMKFFLNSKFFLFIYFSAIRNLGIPNQSTRDFYIINVDQWTRSLKLET